MSRRKEVIGLLCSVLVTHYRSHIDENPCPLRVLSVSTGQFPELGGNTKHTERTTVGVEHEQASGRT